MESIGLKRNKKAKAKTLAFHSSVLEAGITSLRSVSPGRTC